MRTKIQSHFHRTNNNNKTTSRGWWRGVTCWCWSGNMYWLCVLSDSILSLESWYGESGTQEKQTCWSVPCLWLQLRLHTHLLSPATIDSLWLHFNSSLIVTLSRWYYLFDFLCSDIPTCNRESEQRERKKCKGTKSCNSVSKKWKAAKKERWKEKRKKLKRRNQIERKRWNRKSREFEQRKKQPFTQFWSAWTPRLSIHGMTEAPNWKRKASGWQKQWNPCCSGNDKAAMHSMMQCFHQDIGNALVSWKGNLSKDGARDAPSPLQSKRSHTSCPIVCSM